MYNSFFKLPTIKISEAKVSNLLIACYCKEQLTEMTNSLKLNEQQVQDVQEDFLPLYNVDGYEKVWLFYCKKDKTPKNTKCLATKIEGLIRQRKVKNFDIKFSNGYDKQAILNVIKFFTINNEAFEIKDKAAFEPVEQINILTNKFKEDDQEYKVALASALHTVYTKVISNTRADVATTDFMVKCAQDIKNTYPEVELKVFQGEKVLAENNLGLIHAVGKGSQNEPCLINLNYKGNPNSDKTLALIGKGIVYDAGGYCIKTAEGMFSMFLDKCGAVTVMSAFRAIVDLKLKVNLTCSLGVAENMINQAAYRPADIIKSHKGLTVEVINTDAEGRLVLADAMSWTQANYKVTEMIELSTLTGALLVALGMKSAGIFGNDETLIKNLIKSGETQSEQIWHLPIFEEHRETMVSQCADLRNAGKTRMGGSCSAAAFLEKFVYENTKWVHIDIAGPVNDGNNYATGFGTQFLIEYINKHWNNQ